MRQPDWQTEDGAIRLYCGDCLEVLPELDAESCDMIWTDPPYGHANGNGDLLSRRGEAVGDGVATRAVPILHDTQDEMRFVVGGMLTHAARVLRKDCCCCCCCCCGGGGPRPTFAWVANRMDEEGLAFFHSVIWDKNNPGMGWRYRRQHEMVMVSHRRGGSLAWADPAVKSPNIIRMSKPRGGEHPNEKPIALVELFVSLHTHRSDSVLDPFMGSGTTGVACINTGRRFIGIEKEPKYFDVAVRRITEAMEKTALLEPTPKIVQRQLLTA